MEKPKDYQLAEAAYDIFWETPQIPFDALAHEYKMKWVYVARTVVELHEQFRRTPESVQKQKATLLTKKVDAMLGKDPGARKNKLPRGAKFKNTEEQRRHWRIAKREQVAARKAKKEANGAAAD
jgi:hypothetical protein